MSDKSHGGNVWTFGAKNKKDLLDFSANINAFGLPTGIKDIIVKNLDSLVHYPMPYAKKLKKQLAVMHNVGIDNVLVSNGSIELIYLLMQALAVKSALIVTPTFSEYERAALAHNVKCLFLKSTERDNFAVSIKKLKILVLKADCIFLCNPNNPTGTLYTRDDLFNIAAICEKNKTYLIVDEAFLEFIVNGDNFSLADEAAKNKYVLVLRSLTKMYAIAGLRLGYLIAHTQSIKKIAAMQYPWSVNVLSQIVGSEVIKKQGYKEKTKALVVKEKEYLNAQLQNIRGVVVFPSETNFILCKLSKDLLCDADVLSKKMMKYNILIRNCYNFRGLNNRFFRVAIRRHYENMQLINALKKEIK